MSIELKQIKKQFGPAHALDHISLTLPPNKILGILGPSGAGKSTLLRIIAGLEIPEEGQLIIDQQEIGEKELAEHRKKVGVVFQHFNLFPHLTALENITYPLIYVHRIAREKAVERGMELLKRFHLEAEAQKKPAELSGGQNQRVAILRAIAIRPKILLFDEPTSALDPVMTAEVLALIAEIRHESSYCLLATHHVHFAKNATDLIAFLADGKLIELSPTSRFFENPSSIEAQNYLEKVLIY